MKIPENVRREFDFYVNYPAMIHHQLDVKYDEFGKSALTAFFLKSSRGIEVPCNDPELFLKALDGKMSVNLQIKMWADGMADYVLGQRELKEYTKGYPDWVFDATVRQAGRIYKRRYGWRPRFLRHEKLLGHTWFPDMDCFDPEI